MNIKEIEKIIGYEYKNEELLIQALTHSSYAKENNVKSYERLEFLGDSLIQHIVSEYLFIHTDKQNEGSLTRKRASIVCEDSFYNIMKKRGLENYIIIGQCLKRVNKSIIADVFEAIVASIFLDSNYESAKNVVMKFLIDTIEEVLSNNDIINDEKDYKSLLQEYLQKNKRNLPEYKIISMEQKNGKNMIELRNIH